MSKMDITPQLAVEAWNTLIQYTRQTECEDCVFEGVPCDLVGYCLGDRMRELKTVVKSRGREET